MSETPVKRRRVHYFSGFDPRGPAHYHRLCREEAARPQPQGGVLRVGAREKLGSHLGANNSRWRVYWRASADAAETVETEHVFMGWDDRIRAHWARTPWALVREFFVTYRGIALGVGPLRARALSRTAFLTGVLPAVFLLLSALAGVAVGLLAAVLGAWPALAVLLGAGTTAALVAWGASAGLFWLLRIFHFIIRSGHAPLPDMQARALEWAETVIAMQAAEPVDEVLLVGHSVGTLVMLDALDALLQDPRWAAVRPGNTTHAITLGHCIPFVALVPTATALRATLQRLCAHPALLWWDVTARIDPLCFYDTHPLAGSRVPHTGLPNPRRHKATFFRMYEPARWARIRRDKIATHFLYLCTPDKAGNFHAMDVLYGPQPLAAHMRATRGDRASATPEDATP